MDKLNFHWKQLKRKKMLTCPKLKPGQRIYSTHKLKSNKMWKLVKNQNSRQNPRLINLQKKRKSMLKLKLHMRKNKIRSQF